jgi:hypothetical protein
MPSRCRAADQRFGPVATDARVAEVVDAQDLGSCAFGRGGSSPPSRTTVHLSAGGPPGGRCVCG